LEKNIRKLVGDTLEWRFECPSAKVAREIQAHQEELGSSPEEGYTDYDADYQPDTNDP
jgi:hypothetical protein